MAKRVPIRTARFRPRRLERADAEESHQHAQRQRQLRRPAEQAEDGGPVAEHRGDALAERAESGWLRLHQDRVRQQQGAMGHRVRGKRNNGQRGGRRQRGGVAKPPAHRQQRGRGGDEKQAFIARGRQHRGQHRGRADAGPIRVIEQECRLPRQRDRQQHLQRVLHADQGQRRQRRDHNHGCQQDQAPRRIDRVPHDGVDQEQDGNAAHRVQDQRPPDRMRAELPQRGEQHGPQRRR